MNVLLHELVHRSTLFQMIIQVSQLLLSPVALIFCGHLGDAIQLDGAALAISVCTISLPFGFDFGLMV